jgi:predicted ATP-grasp superfamily ATP-dependent carboligase
LLGDLNMLRCFDGAGLPVVIATHDPDDITLASRCVRPEHKHVIASLDDPERAIADLTRIADELPARPVLYYGTDKQLLFLSRQRARLADRFAMQLPPAELIELLVDKRLFASRAHAAGLPVPATVCSKDITGPDEALARVPVPCVIKPNVHIGWFARMAQREPRKALIASTPEQLRSSYAQVAAHTPDFVVQQYIPGGEELIYSYHAYVDAGGRTLAEFVGKKVRTFPRDAGISTYLELVKEPRVLAIGRDAVARLGLVGPMKIDLKMHADTGELFILEVNPRFNLWHYLGAVSGINLPLVAYADLTGTPLPPVGDYTTDVRWLSFDDDLRSFLRSYHPAGELGWMDWLGSLRGRKIYDVFAWRDPLPMAHWLARFGQQVGHKLGRRLRAGHS